MIGRVEMFISQHYAIVAWDGNQWNTLASVTDNSSVHNTLTFNPVRTSKLRLVANGGSKSRRATPA